jgi:hypothetical protein
MSEQNIANAPKYNKNRNSVLNARPKKPPLNANVPTGAAMRANHFVDEGNLAASSNTWMTNDRMSHTPACA